MAEKPQRDQGCGVVAAAPPTELPITIQPTMSTQSGFGALLSELAREKSPFVEHIVNRIPDVTV
jgi:pyruvate dehydrogenase E1 component